MTGRLMGGSRLLLSLGVALGLVRPVSALPPLFSEQITCALEGKPNPLRARSAAAC